MTRAIAVLATLLTACNPGPSTIGTWRQTGTRIDATGLCSALFGARSGEETVTYDHGPHVCTQYTVRRQLVVSSATAILADVTTINTVWPSDNGRDELDGFQVIQVAPTNGDPSCVATYSIHAARE